MSFIGELRAEKPEIKFPTQHGFNLGEWSIFFEKNTDGSQLDRDVFEIGKLIHRRLHALREEFAPIDDALKRLNTFDALKAHVSWLNKNFIHHVVREIGGIGQNKPISQEEIIARRPIVSPYGTTHTFTEMMEHLHDAARFPLRRAMQDRCDNRSVGDTTDSMLKRRLDSAFVCGQYYHALEELWQLTVWYGAKYLKPNEEIMSAATGGGHVIDFTASGLNRRASIDQVRRQALYQRNAGEIEKMGIVPTTSETNILLFHSHSQDSLSTCRIADAPNELRERVSAVSHHWMAIIESEVEVFLEVTHPQAGGLKVKHVVNIWRHLAILAVQIAHSLIEEYASGNIEIRSSAWTIKKEHLISQLCQVEKISFVQADAVIKLFTFDHSQNSTSNVWERPLIACGEFLHMVLLPFAGTHPMRLLRAWSETEIEKNHPLRVAFAKRGNGFETRVVNVLSAACLHTRLRAKCFSIGPKLKPHDEKIGDVDAVLVVDNTAFVIECHVSRHPATPYEYSQVQKELEEKMAQAIRKRDHFASNPSDFARSAARFLKNPGLRVFPERFIALIVSNSFLRERDRTQEPYFVHQNTLMNAVSQGLSQFGDATQTGEHVVYSVDYTCEEKSAANTILRLIRESPKAEFYDLCHQKKVDVIPGIGLKPRPIFLTTDVFAPPVTGGLKSILDASSFAQFLKTHS